MLALYVLLSFWLGEPERAYHPRAGENGLVWARWYSPLWQEHVPINSVSLEVVNAKPVRQWAMLVWPGRNNNGRLPFAAVWDKDGVWFQLPQEIPPPPIFAPKLLDHEVNELL